MQQQQSSHIFNECGDVAEVVDPSVCDDLDLYGQFFDKAGQPEGKGVGKFLSTGLLLLLDILRGASVLSPVSRHGVMAVMACRIVIIDVSPQGLINEPPRMNWLFKSPL